MMMLCVLILMLMLLLVLSLVLTRLSSRRSVYAFEESGGKLIATSGGNKLLCSVAAPCGAAARTSGRRTVFELQDAVTVSQAVYMLDKRWPVNVTIHTPSDSYVQVSTYRTKEALAINKNSPGPEGIDWRLLVVQKANCPAGSAPDAALAACKCLVGWAATNDGSCARCAADLHWSDASGGSCKQCPGISVSAAGAVSVSSCRCPVGSVGAGGADCRKCAAGTYVKAGGCTNCAAGKYGKNGACQSCAEGYFANSVGMSACLR